MMGWIEQEREIHLNCKSFFIPQSQNTKDQDYYNFLFISIGLEVLAIQK